MDFREIQQLLLHREDLEAELASLHQKAEEMNICLRREKINLDYERSDVEALEGNTLKSFFYSAIGKKEEKRMQEEDEADEAERKYEATKKELQEVESEIRRVELALKKLKQAERDYKMLVETLPAKIEAVKPRLTDADAIALEQIQRTFSEQAKKQALYLQITEEGKTLQRSLAWVEEALREAQEVREQYRRYNNILPREYYERTAEAKARRQAAEIQAQRIQELLRGISGASNAYGVQAEHSGTLPTDKLLRWSGNVVGNIGGIMGEVAERMQRSKTYQAEQEIRLSDLLRKYEV